MQWRRPKWGRRWKKFEKTWEKIQKNEEKFWKYSYLAHPGLRGWLRLWPHVTIFWQFSFDFMKPTLMKFDKESKFWNFLSVKLLSHGPLNSGTIIFTRLQRLLTISDRGRIVGLCCPNQIKNHHFVICRALTNYLSVTFTITNNHTELQSPREGRFCLLCWFTFDGTL